VPQSPKVILVIGELCNDPACTGKHAAIARMADCHVATAPTANAGLLAAETGIADAIVLDLDLSDSTDGLSVLRKIRARDRTTPIAIVVQHQGLVDAVKAEVQDMKVAFAFKPLSNHDCRTLVRRLLAESPPAMPCR
jgi:DNA-binding NtrC family response regulator